MIAPFPALDRRQASDLYDELEAIASLLLPEWRGAELGGEFGNALLQIVARLGEHVTQRIDRTPRRDALAFYNMLDIPADGPRPATVPLVFLLAEKRRLPVFAPTGIQAGASSDDGEVLFETLSPLNLTPARLEFLGAADSSQDTIEEAPPGFLELKPPAGPLPDFRVASFASADGSTLQVEPAEGLEQADVIRVDKTAYRIKENEDGLLTLYDELEADVKSNSRVEKVAQFDAFALRNLQSHIVYIGHAELLNLEEPSTILVSFQPESVARQLVDLGVVWEVYGTSEEKDGETGWHPLAPTSGKPGQLVLLKDWRGTVDETRVGSNSNRWLRMRYEEPILDTAVPFTRTRGITLGVKTTSGEIAQQSADAGAQIGDKCESSDTTRANDVTGMISTRAPTNVEGSRTIDQAFHNGSPLPLTTRFHPFGPEPQRFDTFALAAPEAFSKKGAKVTLEMTLVDASVACFDIAHQTDGPVRAYAVSEAGRLQLIALEGEEIHWQEFTHPSEFPETEPADSIGDLRSLRIGCATTPQAVQVHTTSEEWRDLIVVRDIGNRLWATVVTAPSQSNDVFRQLEWKNIDPLPGSFQIGDFVLLPDPASGSGPPANGFVIAAGEDNLYQHKVSAEGTPTSNWVKLNPGANAPSFEKIARIVPELNPDWPQPPAGRPIGIIALDDEGHLWRAELGTGTSVNWEPFVDTPQASADVRPVAAMYRQGVEDRFVVFAAKQSDHQLFAVRNVNGTREYVEAPIGFHVRAGTSLRCNPGFLDAGAHQPIVIAFGNDPIQIGIWTHEDRLEPSEIPTENLLGAVPDALITPPIDGTKRLLLAGTRETLFTTRLTRPTQSVKLELFDTVVMDDGGNSAHYRELVHEDAPLAVKELDHNPAINEDGVRAYPVEPSEELKVGDTYRLFRRKSNDVRDLEGSIVDGDRKQLNLADVDTTTEEGDWLIIGEKTAKDGTLIFGDKAHLVESIVDRVATLDTVHSVTTIPVYTPVEVRFPAEPPGVITEKNLATLFRLTDLDARPRPTALRFGDPADPEEQPIYLADQQPNGVWVLLADGWTTEPAGDVAELLLDLGIGEWSSQSFQRSSENPELAWEYFDGDAWRRLETKLVDTTNHLAASGVVSFTVPDDFAVAEIAGQEDYWVRARLVGGDYGRARYVVQSETDQNNDNITIQTVTVDASKLNPPEVIRVDAYFDAAEDQPQAVLVENNLDIRNQSQANQVPDAEFELFEGVKKINGEGAQRALYFGFGKRFDVRPLSMFVDAEDQEQDVEIDFEVLAQDDWRRVAAEDETHGFHRRGFIQMSVDAEPRKARIFGRDLHWLRVRPRNAAVSWAPCLRSVFVNAARAEQAKTIEQEVLGSSSGEPGILFTLANQPVLPDSLRLRVSEKLSDEEREALNARAEDLPEEDKPVTQYPDLSLPGDWVLWTRVDSFIGYDADARVYRLDAATGEVAFGRETRTPPAGRDNIRAITYQTGGGSGGNVHEYTITALKSAVEAVEAVANPIPAAGGTDTPSIDAQIVGAPAVLRHARHALTPPDIEALAVSTSPDLVRARCLFPESPGAPIRVAIAKRTGERCPRPSLADRQAIADRIREQSWGALGKQDVQVTAPEYLRTRLHVRLRATSTEQAAALEQAATTQLRLLLHPVAAGGGPSGNGWPFGRRVWESDVYRALTDLPGFDRVENIELTPVDPNHNFEGMSPLALICAEEADVQAVVELGNGGN